MIMRWFICLGFAVGINFCRAGTINYTAQFSNDILTIGYTGDDPYCVSLLLDGDGDVHFTEYLADSTDPYFDLFPDYFENGAVDFSYGAGHPVADPYQAKSANLPAPAVALSAGHLLGESDGSGVIARFRLEPTSQGINQPAAITITHDAWRNGNRDGDGAMTTNLPLVINLPVTFTSLSQFVLTQCRIMALVDAPYAMAQLIGGFDADAEDLAGINAINLTVTAGGFTYSEAIPFNESALRNGFFIYQNIYARLDHRVGLLLIDLRRKMFLLYAPSWPLQGLTAPFSITIDAGGYQAATAATEDIINGAQMLPVQLLQTVRDSLTVTNARLMGAAGQGRDTLIVSGTRTDINAPTGAELMVITWGSQTFTVAPTNWQQSGPMRICTNVTCPEEAKVTALFNSTQCTFQITISQTDITSRNGEVVFGLQEGNFHQTATVNPGP